MFFLNALRCVTVRKGDKDFYPGVIMALNKIKHR